MGFVQSTTYPDTTAVTRTNTGEGQIAALSQGGAAIASYQYVGSRPARRVYPVPSVTTDSGYDNLGRITAVDAGTTLAKFRTTYVANEHNIDRQYLDHRTNSPYNQFSYDNLDRLTGVTYHDSDSEVFGMDDLGNRDGNQTLRDAGTVSFLVDDDTNRYTSIGGNTITHDAAGNLTRGRQDYRYEYDYENRIARIYKLSGQSQVTVATFDYDALGHRVRKIDAIAGQTTLYYNDPEWRVLAEYNGSGTLQRTFVWGNYIDEALRMRAGGSDYYYLHDHLYSPGGLVNSSGTVVERYEYDAYGTARVINRGPDNLWFTADDVITGFSTINTTLFTGRTLDALDSANLKISYYRHRYTDPFTGRFLQQDPIGYEDGLNPYQYVSSNPLVLFDPYGLDETSYVPSIPINNSLKSDVLSHFALLALDHAAYHYYTVTGLNQMFLKVNSALEWIPEDNYFTTSGDPKYDKQKIYFNLSILDESILHEGIHAYNDMTNMYEDNRSDEGIAWAAGKMVYALPWFRSLEEEINRIVPRIDGLRLYWQTGWSSVNQVIGSTGKVNTFWGLKDFTIDARDVARVESHLGYSMRCSKLANYYNNLIWPKLGTCVKFKCTTYAPAQEIPVKVNLNFQFK